jgi:hypothetical protein
VAVLAITGAVASCTSFAQSEFGILDGVLGERAADRAGFWLGVGGAAACLGAGALVWLGTAASTSSAVSAAGEGLTHGAAVVGGVAGMAAGGASIARDYYQQQAGHHQADATNAWLDAQMQQFLVRQLLEDLSETKERETANVTRIVAMTQLNDAALDAAAQGVA